MSSNNTRSENPLDLLFEYSPNLILIHDLEGNIVDVNKNLIKVLGYKSKEEILKLQIKNILNYEYKDFTLSKFLKLILNKSKHIEYYFKTKKNSYIPVEGFGFPYKMGNLDVIVNISTIIHDKKKLQKELLNTKSQLDNLLVKIPEIRLWVLSQKKDSVEILQKGGIVLKESEKKYREILESIKEGYFEVDLEGNLIFFNDSLSEILGFSPEELVGKNYRDFIEFEKEKLEEFINIDEIDGKAFEFELIKKNREKIYVESSLSKKQNTEGILIGFYGLIRDVTKRKEAENKINRKIEFERIISKISSLFINPLNYDDAINASLEFMGNLSNASRSYLFLFNNTNKTMDNTHEWCAKGITAEKENLQGLPQDIFPWWIAKLNNEEVIHITDVSMMPEEAAAEQDILKQQDIKSLLVFPLFIGDILSGFIGYDNVRETGDWDKEDFFILQISSDIIGNALRRKQVEEKLKDSEQNLLNLNLELEERIKLRTKELRESEERYRNLIETTPAIIQSVRPDGSFIFINQTWLDTFGYTREEVHSLNLFDIIHPKSQQHCQNFFSRIMQGESLFDIKATFVTKDGKPIYLEGNANPYFTDDKVTATRGIFHNITERKKAEQKLIESEKKYREAYNRANFYSDLFIHDMNNILQNMLSSSELCKTRIENIERSEDIKEILDISIDQVKRGSKLVSNVQKLSKIEESEVVISPIEFIQILKNSITLMKNSVLDKEISINIDSLSNQMFIQGNELLQDVFENILNNSVKYNENPLVEILIKISKVEKNENRYVKMEFMDNGIGIRDSKKKIIFKKGYADYKGGKGMGLGLALVKKIIDSYHGEIWVEDKVKGEHSKGSNFIIIIPEE